MDKEYVYDDEQETEGLTFKKIGRFLSRGWLRMVVYLIVAALLVTAIAVPVKVFKSEPIAKTSIEYIYDGIDKGQDPNGKTLSTDDIINPTVLAKAVEQANLGKKIKDITTLRNAMRVEAVLTDEYVELAEAAANGDTAAAERLRHYNMFPTRFDVIISDPSGELDLSDDQAKLLLNKIVTCYFAEFKTKYSIVPTFEETTYDLSQNETLEFVDVYDTYLASLGSVKAFLQDVTASDIGFISTADNTTFAQLNSDINVLSSSYNQFNAFILSNNIWRDKISAKHALEESKIAINNNLTPQEAYITQLTAMINNIQPNTSTTDSGGAHTVTVSYPPEYFVYQARLDEANRQVRDYNIQLNNIDTRLENLKSDTPTDAALISQAVVKLADIETRTLALIQKVKSTVAEYYDTTFVSASVRQVQPPVVTRKSIEFSLLVVYAVALIVALLAAGIVTGVKMSKAASKAKAEAESEPEEENKH